MKTFEQENVDELNDIAMRLAVDDAVEIENLFQRCKRIASGEESAAKFWRELQVEKRSIASRERSIGYRDGTSAHRTTLV